MVVNFWRLALLIISDVCSGMRSIHVNSWNNSGFSVVTMCSLVRDLCNIADLSSRDVKSMHSCHFDGRGLKLAMESGVKILKQCRRCIC